MAAMIVDELTSEVAAVYNTVYVLFGPTVWAMILAYLLYIAYPHSVTLQYTVSRIYAKLRWWINRDSLQPNERAWLSSVEKVAFRDAIEKKDWAAARKMKKLAGNRDELFEYLLEYLKVDTYIF